MSSSSSTSSTPSPASTSRLPLLLERFQNQIRRIDALEGRVNERARRTRRRIENLLDQQRLSHRQTHLRLFVTHSVTSQGIPFQPQASTDPLAQQQQQLQQPTEQQTRQEWKLLIEGKLLIGALDRESAAAYDRKTGYTPPNDDLDRSKGEVEEEDFKDVHFTHCFDGVKVQFQPLFQPKPNPMSKKTPPKTKKSRRGSTKSPASSAPAVEEVDPRLLVQGQKTELVWNRNMTEDAHAWCMKYVPPPPPGHHLKLHSIVAEIRLFSHRPEDLYQASPELAEALFPNHGPEIKENQKGSSKKRKADEMASTEAAPPPPPTETEIHIPQGLTMKEIALAFFTYIQDRNLMSDETDKSIIVCDKTLRALFDVDRLPFHQLQQVLLRRNLIRSMSHDPVELTYIMKSHNATPARPELESEENPPALLQVDMDASVPALFPFRTRELLRRIKRRELEFTSSRTKARYILMARKAKNEDDVKNKIDQVVAGHSLRPDLQPVMAALAKAAPPKTEARMASHYDLRMSYLLERLREHQQAALSAWELVELCRRGGGSNHQHQKEDGSV